MSSQIRLSLFSFKIICKLEQSFSMLLLAELLKYFQKSNLKKITFILPPIISLPALYIYYK